MRGVYAAGQDWGLTRVELEDREKCWVTSEQCQWCWDIGGTVIVEQIWLISVRFKWPVIRPTERG